MGLSRTWRPLLLAALAASFYARPARATPVISPAVEQCDGSFVAGGSTNKDSPRIQARLQDTINGLKIGQQPPTRLNGTIGLWHLDGNVNQTCGASSTYAEPGSPPIVLKSCPGAQHYFTQGRFNQALIFYSTDAYYASFNLTASTPIAYWDLPPDYTLSAWILASGTGTIVGAAASNHPYFWHLDVNDAGQLLEVDIRDFPSQSLAGGAPGALTDGNWHYVAAVRRNGIDRRLFIDGLLVATSAAASTVTYSTANGNQIDQAPEIGAFGPGFFNGASFPITNYYNGLIDELRITQNAASDETLLLEYNAAVHRFSSDSGATFATATYAALIPSNPANGTTADVVYQPPVQAHIGPQHRYIFYAQSADGNSTTFSSPPYGVTVDKTGPSAPAMAGGAASSPLDITWTWSAPTHLCGEPTSVVNYTVVNSTSGAAVSVVADALSFAENFPFDPPNQLHVRQVKAADYWASGPLSASATAYTLSAAPTGLTAANVSTGSLTLSWNANNNPNYTRYEVLESTDNFAASLSTLAAITDATPLTAASIQAGNLAPGTTYYFRVRAANGRASDNFGNLFTAPAALTAISLTAGPSLSGASLSQTAVQWSWTSVTGAVSYRLYSAGGGPLLAATPSLSFTYTGLSTNTAYGAQVAAVNSQGTQGALSSTVYVFTQAAPPLAPTVAKVATNTISYAWNANGNPPGTLYELSVATDPAFAVVVATQVASQTGLAVGGLFPSQTYYGRVRAVSGGQIPTAFALFGSTATDADPSVAFSSSPPSLYAPPSGTVGLWHFDESTGTTAGDSSGLGNAGALACLGAGCASTPTWAGGPPNLGAAVQYPGAADSLVLIPAAPAYNLTGSITVSAWADPAALAEVNGAALVAQGNGGAEDFALDVFGGKYRFIVNPGVSVIATSTIRLNQWDYVVGVYDQARSTASIYINGILSNTSAAPARSYISRPISVGSRQSGSGVYDLAFNGKVDEVRLINGALTPAQVLSDYQSSFPSTVTLSLPVGAVRLILPPNAFGGPAQIFASDDPVNHPLRVSLSALTDGLANTPTGQVLLPGSLLEIVPTVGGLPFTGLLGSPATLALPYADSGGRGLVDGTSPAIPVSSLSVYTLDATVRRWNILPSTLDRAGRLVWAQTPHFSVFGLFGVASVAPGVSLARAYPNPWKAGSGGKFDAAGVTFDNLPSDGFIRIFSLSGEKVNELAFTGADAGRVVWDGKNSAGARAASGVYFAYVKSPASPTGAVVKFAIER